MQDIEDTEEKGFMVGQAEAASKLSPPGMTQGENWG